MFTFLISFFTISNFVNTDNKFFKRNINLGLYLKGGAYLLLEIDNSKVVIKKI